MSPGGYFNSESAELSEADYSDVADHVVEPAPPSEPAKPKPATPSEAPPLKPGWPVLDTLEKIEQFRSELKADVYHPALSDPALMDYYAQAQWRLDGKGEGEPTIIGELFEGGRLRPPGADALSPAPRPELPADSGVQWDEAALVEAEQEAHACGLPSHVVMTATDALRNAVAQAEVRGVDWSYELAGEELGRRYGRDGAQQMADRARIAYQTIVESTAPRLVQRVKELGKDWGDDPHVIEAFAALYEEIRSAPMTPKLEALILRRTERAMRAEAKAKAEAETIRREQDAEGDDAVAARMAATALAHRRWQPRP